MCSTPHWTLGTYKVGTREDRKSLGVAEATAYSRIGLADDSRIYAAEMKLEAVNEVQKAKGKGRSVCCLWNAVLRGCVSIWIIFDWDVTL